MLKLLITLSWNNQIEFSIHLDETQLMYNWESTMGKSLLSELWEIKQGVEKDLIPNLWEFTT